MACEGGPIPAVMPEGVEHKGAPESPTWNPTRTPL